MIWDSSGKSCRSIINIKYVKQQSIGISLLAMKNLYSLHTGTYGQISPQLKIEKQQIPVLQFGDDFPTKYNQKPVGIDIIQIKLINRYIIQIK